MNTRKAIHNPRATAAKPCLCPACERHRTIEGRHRADEWNGYARAKISLFAIILTGDALAPRFRSGDTLAIDRDRKPMPGNAVLAALADRAQPRAVMILNGDGDLTDYRGGYVPRGAFTVEGVVSSCRSAAKV